MATKTDTTTGTITLTSGSTAFTTVGTNMLTRGHLPGDTIMHNGFVLVIETITGENAGTLRDPCPAGAAGAAVPVRIRYQPDGSRVMAAARALIELLGNGNVSGLAGLTLAANKLIKGVGAGVLGVQDFAAWAQSMLALPGTANRLPYLDAANTAALTPLTDYARSILDDADAATARGTLGLSTAALTDTPGTFTSIQRFNAGITVNRDRPSDFWSVSSGWVFGEQGYLGHNGNNTTWLMNNGYRNSSSSITTMGNNGSNFVAAIELSTTNTQGVLFRMDTSPATASPTIDYRFTQTELRPETNNAKNLGLSGARWSNVYLVNAPNVSSDERTKSIRGPLTVAEVAAGIDIGRSVLIYQRLDSIAVEGDDARLHIGVSAQAVGAIMKAHGLDPARYSFWCADPLTRTETYKEPWTRQVEELLERQVTRTIPATEESPEQVIEEVVLMPEMVEKTDMVEKERFVPVLDENGEQIVQLSIRYEQLAMFVAAAQAINQDRLEARIAILETAK